MLARIEFFRHPTDWIDVFIDGHRWQRMHHQDWYLRTVYHYAINYGAQIDDHSDP
jgi:hypothetical protein